MEIENLLCLILLVVIVFICIYLWSNKSMSSSKTITVNISPYVMIGALKDNDTKVAMVNVLGDKIPFKIDCFNSVNNLLFTKEEFETYLLDSGEYDMVILYCASWSCGAAGNYYKELDKSGIDMSNIYDYKGALHEWALYSYSMPNLYLMRKNSDNEIANQEELLDLIKGTQHSYLLRDEKKSEDKNVVYLADKGKSIIG